MTTRTARAPLSRERLIAAAMAIADGEGLAAVTMRRLGADLGVEAMSLYHHVSGKDQLMDALTDAVLAEVEAAVHARNEHHDRHDGTAHDSTDGYDDRDDDREWRADLRERCLTARTVMVRHRWAPGLLGSRRTIPPRLYRYYDAVLATMVRGGLSYRLAHQGIHALGTMVLGFTQELFTPEVDGGALDEAAAEAEFAAMAAAVPHLAAMVAAEVHDHAEDPLGWCDSQNEFEFTLDLLLDGLDGLARRTG